MFFCLLLLPVLFSDQLPVSPGSFVNRAADRSQLLNPLDRAHSLKLRTGFDGFFGSFSSVKDVVEGYFRDTYSFIRLRALIIDNDRTSRIIAALGLSVVLIFLIFFVALQLQRAVIMRAFAESEKDAPRVPQSVSSQAVAN